MATRIYTQSSGTVGVTPATWNHANQVNPVTVPGSVKQNTGSAMTTKTEATGTTSPIVKAMGRTVIGPIRTGLTISGTVKGQMRGSESNAGANATLSLAVKIIKPDGTDRGVLLAATASDNAAAPNELVTALTNSKFADAAEVVSIALTSQAATAGDYLVIEWGFRSATTTTRNISLSYGNDNATDLGENTSDTTAFNPWWEFSATIDFSQDLTNATIASGSTLAAPTTAYSIRPPRFTSRTPVVDLQDQAQFVDTWNTSQSNWQKYDPVNPSYYFGQSFHASSPFSSIEVPLTAATGTPDGTFVMTLYLGDLLTGSLIATAADVAASVLEIANYKWIKFTFPTLITPSGSTLYTWKLIRNGATTRNCYIQTTSTTPTSSDDQWNFQGGPVPTLNHGATFTLFSRVLGETAAPPAIAAAAQALTGGFISSGSSVGAPTVAYKVQDATIAAATSVNAPTAAYAVTNAAIAAATSVNAPTAAYEVNNAAIASGASLAAPTVAPGAVTLDLPAIASGSSTAAPATAYEIDLATVAAATTLNAPTVTPGAVTVDLPTIAAGSSTAAPSAAYEVDNSTIAAGSSLAAPTVTPDAVTLDLPTIAATTIAAPTAAYAIDLETISDTTLAAPIVEPGAVTLDLPTISATTVHAPTAAYEVDTETIAATTLHAPTAAYAVDLPTIDETTLAAPEVTSGARLELTATITDTTIHAPTVTPGAVDLALPTIAATTRLYPPARHRRGTGAGGRRRPEIQLPPRVYLAASHLWAAERRLEAVVTFDPAVVTYHVVGVFVAPAVALEALVTFDPAVVDYRPAARLAGSGVAVLRSAVAVVPWIAAARRRPTPPVSVATARPRRPPSAQVIRADALDDDALLVHWFFEDVA